MDYLYIRAWEKMMCSLPFYLELQLEKARKTQAPQTAIYLRRDGTWARFEEIQRDDTRAYVQRLVNEMKEADAHGKDNA